MHLAKVAKWVFTCLAIAYLGYELFVKHDVVELMQDYRLKVNRNIGVLALVAALMPVNWLIDSMKWRWLLKKHHNLSIGTSVKGVLMGLSVGLFTPNGVGEFAGRMLAVPSHVRQQSVAASIAGSLAQLAITITVGGACIMFFASQYVAPSYLVLSQTIAVGTVVFGFYAYFRLPQIADWVLSRFSWLKRFERFRSSLAGYNRKELLGAYGFALLRYVVFCTQLAILLFAVGGLQFTSYGHLIWLIPIYYYIQTVVPTIALSEIGIRGLILSSLFVGVLGESEVLLASFIIWVVNLIIPGLLGLVFLNRSKITTQ